jgi:hypothetical protein
MRARAMDPIELPKASWHLARQFGANPKLASFDLPSHKAFRLV